MHYYHPLPLIITSKCDSKASIRLIHMSFCPNFPRIIHQNTSSPCPPLFICLDTSLSPSQIACHLTWELCPPVILVSLETLSSGEYFFGYKTGTIIAHLLPFTCKLLFHLICGHIDPSRIILNTPRSFHSFISISIQFVVLKKLDPLSLSLNDRC